MALTVEDFIDNWNANLPQFPLTTPDLKNSHVVMGAIFHIFDRLGIDLDTVLAVRFIYLISKLKYTKKDFICFFLMVNKYYFNSHHQKKVKMKTQYTIGIYCQL